MDAEKALAALTAFKSGGITERLSEYATNPDDPLHADDARRTCVDFHDGPLCPPDRRVGAGGDDGVGGGSRWVT